MSRCYVLSDAVPSDSFMCAAHFITHLETVVFGARRWLIFKSAFSYYALQSLLPFQEPSGAPDEPR